MDDTNRDEAVHYRRLVEWVAWFEVDGYAHHYPADSPRGRWVLAQLAGVAARPCAVEGCERPARGRSRACSDSHARALRRPRFGAPDVRVSGVSAIAQPDTPQTRTSRTPRPGTTRPVIADTADNPGRRCANCGRDISGRRAGAVVCGDTCRKAIARRARRIAGQAELTEVLGEASREPAS